MDSTAASPLKSSGQVLGACPHDCPEACSFVTTVAERVSQKFEAA